MPIDEECLLERLPAFIFCILGCPLTATRDALTDIAAKDQNHYQLSGGELESGEVFAQEKGYAIVRRQFSKSYVALLYSVSVSENTLVLSSVPDGWITLCNAIAFHNRTYRYCFELSGSSGSDARNAFGYLDYSTEPPVERVVYAMKDPGWIFFQFGAPLWFEDVKHYEERRINKRLNRVILEKYCKKLGLDIGAHELFCNRGPALKFVHTW